MTVIFILRLNFNRWKTKRTLLWASVSVCWGESHKSKLFKMWAIVLRVDSKCYFLAECSSRTVHWSQWDRSALNTEADRVWEAGLPRGTAADGQQRSSSVNTTSFSSTFTLRMTATVNHSLKLHLAGPQPTVSPSNIWRVVWVLDHFGWLSDWWVLSLIW